LRLRGRGVFIHKSIKMNGIIFVKGSLRYFLVLHK
jgi:hypothetical protein